MKKLFYLFLLSMITLSFTACGDDDEGDNGGGGGTTTTDPNGIDGKWVCDRLEADIEAETQETRGKIYNEQASAQIKASIRLYREYDYTESYKKRFPDTQKAVQRMWLKKK